MFTLLVRNFFGSNKPITYLSLIEKAKADYSFYTKLASGSFFAGVSSFFSSSSWLSKIPLMTGAVFGTSFGVKGIMDSNKEIDIFTKAHEATQSKEYLATSELGSLIYGTAINKNGIDKFTGKFLEGENGKIISNEMTRVPTLNPTKDGTGYKHNGGYTIVESSDRVLYQKVQGVLGQYTNKLVIDTHVISLHDSIVQQLIEKDYANEDIEQALNLSTAKKRENYLNEQLKNYKPSTFAKLYQGTEKAIQNKKTELLKEIQKYAEINQTYEALLNYHTSSINKETEEMFYSLDNNNIVTILGAEEDEGYGSDSELVFNY